MSPLGKAQHFALLLAKPPAMLGSNSPLSTKALTHGLFFLLLLFSSTFVSSTRELFFDQSGSPDSAILTDSECYHPSYHHSDSNNTILKGKTVWKRIESINNNFPKQKGGSVPINIPDESDGQFQIFVSPTVVNQDTKLQFGLYEVWTGRWKTSLLIHEAFLQEL